jgi:UDP-2,3-diacylglucosamine pyrophosphatase LpxH
MAEHPPKHYRTLFLSDLHLGSPGCQAGALCRFLKANTAERIVLVGDVIDGWRLQKNWYWPQRHTDAVRRLLTAAKRETDVTYVIGNHDEFLRGFLRYRLGFGRVKLVNRAVHEGADGKRYLVIHGDLFDRMLRAEQEWLMTLGDHAYDTMNWINIRLNWLRRRLGLPYWSLSRFVRSSNKQANAYIDRYERTVARYAGQKGYDGVICGHVHVAAIKTIGGVAYMNDGDWVESCTALAEHHDGSWELLHEAPGHE